MARVGAVIFRDGFFIDAAPLSPMAASFGAFSTFGCDRGMPLMWPAHVERLTMTLSALAPGLPVVLPTDAQVVELLSALGLEGPARGRLVAVLRDERWQIELSASGIGSCGFDMAPLRLRVTRWTAAPPLAGFKTLARLPWDFARRQAVSEGYDDALLIDSESRLLETSIANIFLRFGHEVVTPVAPECCLPGIMRAWLLENLGRVGLQVRECDVGNEDVKRADEIWTSNAIAGLRRVAAVDDVVWTDWPYCRRLRQLGVLAPGC